jgi:hypothetical protein
MRFSKLLTHRVAMLLCCRQHTPAESVTHCEAERGNQLLSRIAALGANRHRMWRSANSFSASPTANPVGARKRKGWFVVLQSCDRLAPTRSSPRAFVRNRGHGLARCRLAHHYRRWHCSRSVGHHDHSGRHYDDVRQFNHAGVFNQAESLEVLIVAVRHQAAVSWHARQRRSGAPA